MSELTDMLEKNNELEGTSNGSGVSLQEDAYDTLSIQSLCEQYGLVGDVEQLEQFIRQENIIITHPRYTGYKTMGDIVTGLGRSSISPVYDNQGNLFALSYSFECEQKIHSGEGRGYIRYYKNIDNGLEGVVVDGVNIDYNSPDLSQKYYGIDTNLKKLITKINPSTKLFS